MDHLPPDDRRISSGAVAAAWALVAGLTVATALASVLAPSRPHAPSPAQHSVPAADCEDDETEAAPSVLPRDE
jgi:hypothetical protein